MLKLQYVYSAFPIQALSIPLNEFDISFKPGEPVGLINTTWDEQEANHWSLKEITLAPNYIAVEASNYHLKFWQFNHTSIDD